MFNLHIIVLGKIKESYWREAINEYLKRLKPYGKIKITEMHEESFRDIGEKEQVKIKEADKIKKQIAPGSLVIACDEHGRKFSSEEFALFLKEHSQHGDVITILLGGPLGLHESILELARHTISLSRLTFPHQLARIILLEQIYRAATIIARKQYHY